MSLELWPVEPSIEWLETRSDIIGLGLVLAQMSLHCFVSFSRRRRGFDRSNQT